MARVVFHRPTVWASDIQCSTKVLSRLTAARGHDVTYLQAPLDPVHLMRGPGGYLKVWRATPRSEAGVHIVTQATPVPVRDIWPLSTRTASHLRYGLARPGLAQVMPDPDLVWTTVPGSGRALKRAFPKARVAFHVVDYYPAFRGDAVKPIEAEDYASVDVVHTISTTLKAYAVDELGVPEGKVHVLGQGVEREIYAGDPAEPAALAPLPHPRAVWTGVLSKGDPALFEAVAAEMKARGGSLALIGPGAGWADDLAARYPGTVFLMGSVAPRDLPAWLVHCDLGVMLYDRSKQAVYKGQNPLKLYEYAAAGLPILSTPHDEYAHLAPPAEVLSDEGAVAPAIARALSDDPDRDRAIDTFATTHSWQSKVDRILAEIGYSPEGPTP